ncbi:PilX N-terminal domain-containing pilus assembly protein [Hydrogenophaga sp.]|uniref:pilus assembly PilX family protein n=1 Tax=Hydrogenophaga sp. TaxID=1904254 RepID=UPI002723E146|nr:PilX N-terminal domain-containing pilus assembly protein [Hydrogenophaga sp.]MDO8903742.1 PilX N-terminal domain-containing pilus assembly protein [Hydrogenophaga sp.]
MMKPTSSQHGFVLITSLIFLIVLSILGVMAMRGSLFEERMAANDRDRALAREYAEMALRDAERDILGIRFNGTFCAAVGCGTLRPAGTRPANAVDAGNFWIAANPIVDDIALEDGGLGQAMPLQGVYSAEASTACGMPVWSGANWEDNSNPPRACAGTIAAAVPTIRYGQFTDAPFVGPDGVAAPQGIPPPRYMIEVFKAADLGIIGSSNKMFFRITAVGFGRTAGPAGLTSVTLQSVFSPL